MALRWKKNSPERDLARVAAGPRGSTLRDGDEKFATVNAARVQLGSYKGWYWVARNDAHGVPLMNTCNRVCEDEATAKEQAMAYVKKCIKEHAARNQTNTKD